MVNLALAIISATTGHVLLSRHDVRGLVFWALAILMLILVLWRQRLSDNVNRLVLWRQRLPDNVERALPATGTPLPGTRASSHQQRYRQLLKPLLFSLATINAVLAFLAASGNTYRWYGVLAWLLATGLFLAIFWERDSGRSVRQKLGFSNDGWRWTWTTLAVMGLILLGFWFRFWRLHQMPSEMTSDHVEKLLDVHDLVTGQRPIFFVRNTGREPWQFYWTLMFIRLFVLETKFFALKLGAAAVGMLMLPGVFLLGKELFNRRVGLWATLFAAVASWPVILSRVGLRFPFAPAATAWSLLYLLRGLRDGRRNDFLLLGLWLGIGLQGYTAFRAMPLAVVLCWALALAIRPSSIATRPSTLLRNGLLTVLIATVVFIPLGRFSIEHPDDFWRRSFSRVADPNRPIPDGPIPTFFKNLWSLALMFNWRGDDVWVNTLADAPVLDPLLGGLFILGLFIVFWRGLRWRDPIAPLLLIAGAILLLPSALSIAYSIENPSVVRAGGAIPVIMVIAALPLGLELSHRSPLPHARQRGPTGAIETIRRSLQRMLPLLGALILAIAVIIVNYKRYFVDYWQDYQRNALNTTEIASAIRGFAESGGDLSNAWIVAWPYWIDTRGVGIELGDPTWNNVILETDKLIDHAASVLEGDEVNPSEARPRFYVLHPADTETLRLLGSLFPQGWFTLYRSQHPQRSFVLFFVPRISTQDLKGSVAYAP